ncbi:MAG TPA: M20/M25/M40 family metallo-hydrolase [Gaiellaceae bacterium]
MPAPELFLDLLRARGPSGHEDEPARVWRDAASAFADVSTDNLGSSVARVGDRDAKPLAIVGHIDEIGLAITHVDEHGLASFATIGGQIGEVLLGQRVQILSRNGPVPAVIGKKLPAPLGRGEEPKRTTLDDLYLDLGAKSRDEALELVRPGDTAVYAADPFELAGGRLASRAIDNRFGAYVALEVVRRLAEAGDPPPVAGVAVVGEEAGDYSGARTALYALRPAVAVVVDVTPATDVPGGDPRQGGEAELGKGPVIGRGLPLNSRLVDLLFETAEQEEIAAATEVVTGTTNTDADAVHLSRAGVPTGLVSIALRYVHMPIELADLADVEACVRLLVAFARRHAAATLDA